MIERIIKQKKELKNKLFMKSFFIFFHTLSVSVSLSLSLSLSLFLSLFLFKVRFFSFLSLFLLSIPLSACTHTLQSGSETQIESFENFSPFCSQKRDRERELFLVPENRCREVFGNCFHENFGNCRDLTGKL